MSLTNSFIQLICKCISQRSRVHLECLNGPFTQSLLSLIPLFPLSSEDYDDAELSQLQEKKYVFKTPDSLRAVFRIDQTHMVFGSFFVSIVGFLQLLLSTIWMGGGGGVFRIGGFGLGGRRRGVRGDRQREASFGGIILAMMLVFGLFKSIYTSYKLVRRVSRHVLAKAEMMVLEVQ
ncbi:hypothetical protein B0O80DRAFT_238825 [Mortierella sp. GBAus27b]|nr:hypothetical protein B0O80DRAFT_238825 [Mortierella sp. GBAus27b]